MDLSELTGDEWTRIVALCVFGLYLASAIPSLFRGRFLTGVLALVAWSAILVGILAGYAYRFELGGVANRIMAVLVPGTVVETGPKELSVFRRPDGQFVVEASAGQARLPFVLDTGASSVVLKADDAARLKIPVRRLTYDVPVATANGRTLAAAVLLPSLAIGPITEHDVPALVARVGTLHENLLGMTFLDRLESYTISNDKLVMRGR